MPTEQTNMSYSDTYCPYCEKGIDIDHDDGYGYEEDKVFTQTCEHCDKTFSYTTSTSFYYETEKAPCQNDEPHKWKPVTGYPPALFVGVERCEFCDKQECHDIEGRKKAIEDYQKELDKNK